MKVEYTYPHVLRLDAPDEVCRQMAFDLGVAEMSRKSRQKSGHDRHYPKDRYSPGKCDYMERQKKVNYPSLQGGE